MKSLLLLLVLVIVGCKTIIGPTGSLEKFTFSSLPPAGTTQAGQTISLGGFSGLQFLGSTGRTLHFVANTDRGPNSKKFESSGLPARVFFLPRFAPELVFFDVDRDTRNIEVVGQVRLRNSAGSLLTGLPKEVADKQSPIENELAFDPQMHSLGADPEGLDLEGVARASDGTFWVSDEYGPSLAHYSSDGRLLDLLVPETMPCSNSLCRPVIPAVYRKREANHGFEGIAIQGDKLYAFPQSPLLTDGKKSKLIRVLEVQLFNHYVSGQYLYRLDSNGGKDIGDATLSPTGQIHVLEHDGGEGTSAYRHVFRLDFSKATNLKTLAPSFWNSTAVEAMKDEELTKSGIQTVSKTEVLDLSASGFDWSDKPEGLAFIDEQTIATLNDNNFGLKGDFNPQTGEATLSGNANPILGLFSLTKN